MLNLKPKVLIYQSATMRTPRISRKSELSPCASAARLGLRTVRQSLSQNPFHCATRPSLIVHTQRNAIAITKIKLREIAVQMLFAAMLIRALHAALED